MQCPAGGVSPPGGRLCPTGALRCTECARGPEIEQLATYFTSIHFMIIHLREGHHTRGGRRGGCVDDAAPSPARTACANACAPVVSCPALSAVLPLFGGERVRGKGRVRVREGVGKGRVNDASGSAWSSPVILGAQCLDPVTTPVVTNAPRTATHQESPAPPRHSTQRYRCMS